MRWTSGERLASRFMSPVALATDQMMVLLSSLACPFHLLGRFLTKFSGDVLNAKCKPNKPLIDDNRKCSSRESLQECGDPIPIL